jgi:hypothetical protein
MILILFSFLPKQQKHLGRSVGIRGRKIKELSRRRRMRSRAATFLNIFSEASAKRPHVPRRASGVGKARSWKHTSILQQQKRFAGGGHGGGKSETAWGRMLHEYPLLFSGISSGLLWGTGDGMAQVLQSQMSDKKAPEQGLTMNRLGGAVAHGAYGRIHQ